MRTPRFPSPSSYLGWSWPLLTQNSVSYVLPADEKTIKLWNVIITVYRNLQGPLLSNRAQSPDQRQPTLHRRGLCAWSCADGAEKLHDLDLLGAAGGGSEDGRPCWL